MKHVFHVKDKYVKPEIIEHAVWLEEEVGGFITLFIDDRSVAFIDTIDNELYVFNNDLERFCLTLNCSNGM